MTTQDQGKTDDSTADTHPFYELFVVKGKDDTPMASDRRVTKTSIIRDNLSKTNEEILTLLHEAGFEAKSGYISSVRWQEMKAKTQRPSAPKRVEKKTVQRRVVHKAAASVPKVVSEAKPANLVALLRTEIEKRQREIAALEVSLQIFADTK